MKCFLGIDLGTSSVKVIVLDQAGALLALSSRSYPSRQALPGYAEQSPLDWWSSTCECVRESMGSLGETPPELEAVGLSGQMHGLVLLDSEGRLLRDAIIWPDRRTTGICAERSLSKRSEAFREITGLPLATGFLAPSLEWVRRNEGELYERAACFMLPKDYIRFRLTGKIATDPTDACGTYLFDIRKGEWSEELLSEFHIDMRLAPEILETMSVVGSVTEEAARDAGLRPGTSVICGGSDQAMAALALGADRPGIVAASISTGGTVITTVDSPLYDPRLHTLRHAFKDRWLMMGATLSAGAALSWFNDKVLNFPAQDDQASRAPGIVELTESAAEIQPGSNGLLFAPYLSGERTPHMNPNAKGCFVGLTMSHTRSHMVRSIMEGVVYSLCESLEIFRELGLPAREIFCLGGGSRSRVWRQMMADIFDSPVQSREFSDFSALGAALAAARACGLAITGERCCGPLGEKVNPVPQNVRTYRAQHEIHKQIYVRLETLFDELSEFPS